jgi:hypothetical protein
VIGTSFALNDSGPISSLAAASLFVVVIAGGGNSFERRKDLVSIKEPMKRKENGIESSLP